MLSAKAQIAASSNKNTEVRRDVVVLVAVISNTLNAFQAKVLLKSSSSFIFKISDVKSQPSHSETWRWTVLNLFVLNTVAASFWNWRYIVIWGEVAVQTSQFLFESSAA